MGAARRSGRVVRWRWWRREPDGEHARATKATADRHLADAQRQTRSVAETTRAARQMVRQVDRFTTEIERALRGQA